MSLVAPLPGVSLVALEAVFSFLGRPRDGFQENTGNSWNHFGLIFLGFLTWFLGVFWKLDMMLCC